MCVCVCVCVWSGVGWLVGRLTLLCIFVLHAEGTNADSHCSGVDWCSFSFLASIMQQLYVYIRTCRLFLCMSHIQMILYTYSVLVNIT